MVLYTTLTLDRSSPDELPSPMPRTIAILVLAGLLLIGGARAAPVEGLYEVEVPLEERSPEALKSAFQQALGLVLVRVIGRRNVMSDPDIEPVLTEAERLVQGWGYAEEDMLRVAFGEAAVQRALEQQGLPIWGRERPVTLVWLVVDSGQGRRSLLGMGEADDEQLREFLVGVAGERGIPLVFPLLDAEDLQSISLSDLWGGFDAEILTASERYGVDAVLVGRASRFGESGYGVRWSLSYGDSYQRWDGTLEQGVDRAADLFAQDFATVGMLTSRDVILTVDGVTTFADYARVYRYLEALTMVRAVAVDRIEQDTVFFRVLARVDEERLSRAIRLGHILYPAPDEPSATDPYSPPPGLHYRLQP